MLLFKCYRPYLTCRKNSRCLCGGCDVYLPLRLHHVVLLSLHPRNVLCMVECRTWNKLPRLWQGKKEGQCFVHLGHEGERGVGARISLVYIVFSFHSFLCVLSQAKKLRTITFADEDSEQS